MSARLPPLSLTGARVLVDGTLAATSLSLAEGRIVSGRFTEVDLSGYLVLPGIVDLHGDAFERHIAPRPSAPFPVATGLAATDRDAAANGVTTAFLAQGWSWEGGLRGPDFAEEVLRALDAYRPHALTDLHVQIRLETHAQDPEDRVLAAVRRWDVRYVVFNDHIGEAVRMASTRPGEFAAWARKAGHTPEDFRETVFAAKATANAVPRRLARLAESFDTLGVTYGSHDDPDGETREFFALIGARICEFPLTPRAAAVARANGNPTLMGAPNVVRGGSQAGNVSARALVERGCCTALVSDYYYPALSAAAFHLADAGVLSLPEAWALISASPARVLGFADRGTFAEGARADIVVLNPETRRVEATIADGRLAFLAGGAATRFLQTRPAIGLAAE